MDLHRVFVIWNHPLFLESLRLLLQNANIEWIGSTSSSESGFAEIQRLSPDTILLEEEENGHIPNNVIDLMDSNSANIRIFRLSLADNNLKIYHREMKIVLQANDLLNLILEE